MSHIDVSASVGVSRPSDSTPRIRSLSGLSDRELLSRVKDLVSRERAVTLEILVHLIEVERRRLHLGLGYASMFDYCTQHLGYSSSSAARRIHTARCVRDYPEIYGLLEKNEVSLSTVSLVASSLTRENRDDILRRIRNKSQKDVEAIMADYRPAVSFRDRARPVRVAVPEPSRAVAGESLMGGALSAPPSDGGGNLEAFAEAPGIEGSGTPTQRTSESDSSRSGSEKTPNSMGGPVPVERKYHVQFLASERFMTKLERVKALLSNKGGSLSYERVLEAALDEFLKDHDPGEREQRREERREKAEARTKSGERAAQRIVRSRAACRNRGAGVGQVDGPLFRRRAGDLPSTRVPADDGSTRHIPATVRDAVFARDKGRCTYVGSTGKRCDATRHLQIDHVVPYARGGTNALGNLRLLCERHNKLEAERLLGERTLRRFRRKE
jgi:hypothetical protein